MYTTDTIPVFKLSDLIKHNSSLQDLGLTLQTRIRSTRFKQRLLAQSEDIAAYNEEKLCQHLIATLGKLYQLQLVLIMMTMVTF